MKKLLAVLLAVLMIFTITGCGDSSGSGYIDQLSTFSVTSREEIDLPSAGMALDDDSSSEAATPSTVFSKGTLIGNTYTNNWANLKFDFYGSFTNGDQSEYDTYGGADGTYCGLVANDTVNKKQLIITFEKLTGTDIFLSAEDYADKAVDILKNQYTKMNYTVEFGEIYNQTIAKETYVSFAQRRRL